MLGRPAQRWVIYLSLVMTTTNVSYVSIHSWRTYQQLADQIQSTIWSVLLNAEFNALQAREVDAKETRCTLRLDLREQKQWRRGGRQPGASN